jgi:DNA-binding CsgD family transcriptional regulator
VAEEGRRVLRGRSRQCGTVERLLADVRAGRSRALVIRGEPGIGKSALLGYAADSAADFRVARAGGVESEMELPFAALQQLCGPMLDRLEELPGPQREALAVAFGLHPGGAPDRFLVGLGVLGLLSDVAMEQRLLCLVDDAHWLDQASAQALAFVARRLGAEPVAVIFGTRDPGPSDGLAGLPDLVLGPLSRADSRALLASAIPGRLDERVRDRITAESGGNPLALLELPREVTAAELAGGFGVAPLAGRIEQSFLRRIASLPEMTQRLLLLAAAEPTGDPALLTRAAGRLAISHGAAAPAEADGLLTVDAHVTFRHPLVRSAVYRAASPAERRAVHRALAEATDPVADPDRRAWHRAQATRGPDEEVAAELEHSADRARARGGLAAAAAFLERSVALTFDPARRADRALAAAQAKYQAGAFDAGLALVAIAEEGPLDEFQRGRAFLLHGQIALASRHGSDALPPLLMAARMYAPLDARLARGAYLEALTAALFSGRLAGCCGLREVAEAARAAGPSPRPARPPDLLLDGLALVITEGYPAGAPLLRRAVHGFAGGGISADEGLRWMWPAGHTASLLWDYESWEVLSARYVRLAREAGALEALPLALSARAGAHMWAGEFAAVVPLVAEFESITEATGSMVVPYATLGLATFQGQETEAFKLAGAAIEDAERRGEGGGLTFIHWATAVLCNSLGRYEQALAAARQASEDSPAQRFGSWAVAELIEAATRTGASDEAAFALRRLSDAVRASGTEWALGTEARCRALATSGQVADSCYREAIDRFGRTRLRLDLGRAHLLYGEWLRRQKRLTDAREQLRAAHQILAAIGADGFAGRTARELRACGERVPLRSTGPSARPSARLTAQETQVARLAAEGLSNPEIAARLFISPRTAEYHLGKVFAKLNIGSRNQLHGLLADDRSQRRRQSR